MELYEAQKHIAAELDHATATICAKANPFHAALDALMWHQADLARATGLTAVTISKLVNGKSKANRAQIAALKWAITARTLNLKG